jgi:DNA (cytosine-5)-methyltransferase 1
VIQVILIAVSDLKTDQNLKPTKSSTLRVFEAFAGYGGASFALKRTGINYKVVGYSENDKFASALYEKNHPGVPAFGDITKLDPQYSPRL